MIIKNEGKKLFAIFKNEIHKGNSYGFDEINALESYLEQAKFPCDKETIEGYIVIAAIQDIHYFKSEFVKTPFSI
jgi:hypothetical protein